MVATAGVPKSMEFFAETRHSYSTPRSTEKQMMWKHIQYILCSVTRQTI